MYCYWLGVILLNAVMAHRAQRLLLGERPKWRDDRHAIDTSDLTALIALHKNNRKLHNEYYPLPPPPPAPALLMDGGGTCTRRARPRPAPDIDRLRASLSTAATGPSYLAVQIVSLRLVRYAALKGNHNKLRATIESLSPGHPMATNPRDRSASSAEYAPMFESASLASVPRGSADAADQDVARGFSDCSVSDILTLQPASASALTPLSNSDKDTELDAHGTAPASPLMPPFPTSYGLSSNSISRPQSQSVAATGRLSTDTEQAGEAGLPPVRRAVTGTTLSPSSTGEDTALGLPATVNGGPALNFSEDKAIVTENPTAGSNGVGGDGTAIKKMSAV